jgi:beta-xylosidase
MRTAKNKSMNLKQLKKKSFYLSGIGLPAILLIACALHSLNILAQQKDNPAVAGNPIIKNKYTADPAAMVCKDSVYLYTGHDEALPGKDGYIMHEWLCFSSADMVNWKEHSVPLTVKDFKWAKDDAWASQVIERNGKFYWYVATEHATIKGKAIGVAVSDSPTGPFKDARVLIDDNGQAYLFWGNTKCYYAPLKENMTELDGPIKTIDLPSYTEAPWIHKHNGWYYLSYAYQFPEKIAYAMSRSINGPWTFKGILNEVAGNSNTNHQSIIDFKGKSYFIYHNGSLPTQGGSFRRSVCIDNLYYNKDGSIKRIVMTTEGVKPVTVSTKK